MSEPDHARVPRWLVVVAAGVLTTATGWASSAVLEVRQGQAVHEERLNRVEAKANIIDTLLPTLADIKSDMRLLTAEVARLREDLQERRRLAPK